ncbi:MAG: hypothetical protein ACRCYY_21690 [Trueperaceae bacterium]
MKLFLFVHKDDTALASFIKAARVEQLTGFTLLPSTGAGRTSQKPIEEFAFGFSRLLRGEGERLKNVTLFSVIADDKLPRLIELMKQHCTDIGQPGAGLYVVLPIEAAGGLEA